MLTLARPLWLILFPLAACAQASGGNVGASADATWLPDGDERPRFDAATGEPADARLDEADAPAASTALRINEFVINHAGIDTSEFIELRGAPVTDYGDHAVLAIEGEGAMTGTIERVIALGEADATGRFATSYLSNQIENDTVTLLVVRGYTDPGLVDLDTNDDGTFDSEPWAELLDAVAVRAAVTGVTYAGDAVLVPEHDAVGLTVGGASRMPDGQDTGGAADWVRNDYDGQGLPCCSASAAAGEALNTAGSANQLAP